MKKQRFELSHDIIAEKVWQRLPEQDKQLRKIQRSITQRQEDYQAGKGSLLGKAELEAWNIYLPMLELTEDEKAYVEESAKAQETAMMAERERLEKEKAQLRRNRRLQRLIAIVLILAMLISFFFIWRASEKTKDAEKARIEADHAKTEAQQQEKAANNAANKAKDAEAEAQQARADADAAIQDAKRQKEEADQARLKAQQAETAAQEAFERARQKEEEAGIADSLAREADLLREFAEAETTIC